MLSSVILQSLRLAYASHLPLHKGGFSKFPPTKKHHQRNLLGGVRVFSAKNAELRISSFLSFLRRAVLAWGEAHGLFEDAAEIEGSLKADGGGNLVDGHGGIPQQGAGGVDADAVAVFDGAQSR